MSNTIDVKPIDVTSASSAVVEAEMILNNSKGVTIHNQPEYESAATMLKEVKARAARLEEERKKLTTPLDETKKRIMDLFRKPQDLLSQAESFLKTGMVAYAEEQERIRREEERRRQEVARKEEERQRKIKEEQERAWREKEEAARREQARLEAEGKAAEAEKARQEAERAAAKAEERAAQAAEVFVPAAAVESTVEQPKGTSMREIWKFEIVDVNAIPREWMVPDEKAIGAAIRASKGKVKILGVRAYPEKSLAA